MYRALTAVLLMSLPGVALAQSAPASSPPQRIRSVTLTKGQACPPSKGDEIVVCQTLDQPYRIPRGLRQSGPIPAQRQSWVNRAAALDQVGRRAGGLPDTCSPVGTGGSTGCALQANQNYAAERRAQQAEQRAVP